MHSLAPADRTVTPRLAENQALGWSSMRRGLALGLLGFWIATQLGCQTFTIDSARRVASIASLTSSNAVGTRVVKKKNSLGPFKRLFQKEPPPSERTDQVLRQFALADDYSRDSDATIRQLQIYAQQKPTLEKVHAVAELAFLQGEWATKMGRNERALTMYSTALCSAHQFLFDPNLDVVRNAYDPQFRSISDIYNRSLEEILRRWIKKGDLTSNRSLEIKSLDKTLQFTVLIESKWRPEEIERFEITNDYAPQGVINHYRTFGLGVPLIGIRRSLGQDLQMDGHYPPDLTMPFTAFLDINGGWKSKQTPRESMATLVLFDPLERSVIQVDNRLVPLESDITTPMAFHMNDPLLSTNVMATFALLNANFAKEFQGIYMLEPYDPNKIPVVMIHGLWSSPVTWLQMFNDLRADKELRDHYQFWFCLYPTGQPFWESARQVRSDLESVRKEMAAQHPSASATPPVASQEMILVGHSMGGLVSRMLTVHSTDQLWRLISEQPIDKLQGNPDTIERIKNTFEFEPVPGISRVITIGTPHRGSAFANDSVKWLGEKFITLPKVVTSDYTKIVAQNQTVLTNNKPLLVATSLDSLTPSHPLFNALLAAQAGDGVVYHNIVGKLEKPSLMSRIAGSGDGDGVVSLESARVAYAVSELLVDEEHSVLHRHPETILEVKRVLYEHLESRPKPLLPVIPIASKPNSFILK